MIEVKQTSSRDQYHVASIISLSMNNDSKQSAWIHGDPWFEDGNIILMPESGLKYESEAQVAFKVHRGMLARHSEIFHSMFDIPQPGEI